MDPRNLNTPLQPLQGVGSNLAKINSLGVNMAKINSLGVNLATIDTTGLKAANTQHPAMSSIWLNPVTSGATPCDAVVSGTKAWETFVPDVSTWSWSTGGWAGQVKTRIKAPEFSQSQRDWLARGIRSWAYKVESRPDWEVSDLKPREIYHELGHFLVRRRFEASRKRGIWADFNRQVEVLWDWFDYLHRSALPRLASSLDPTAISHELLAVLAVPRGWTEAVRSRVVLEDLIPRTLQRLAQVILPNAPSRRPRHPAPCGTTV